MIANREEWLAERRTGVGASDIAAILGLSPWKTALHVYAEKLQLCPDQPMTEEMEAGLILEDAIATLYERRTGIKVEKPPQNIRHPDLPFLIANLDRRQISTWKPVELKNTWSADGWGDPGTDEIPAHYLVQVQHQIFVSETEEADVAALFGGNRLGVYTVHRHDALIEKLIVRAREFWQMVEAKTPPEPDWEKSCTVELMSKLYEVNEGLHIDLGMEARMLADLYIDLGGRIKRLEKERGEAKARLLHEMGAASSASLPGGMGLKRSTVRVGPKQVEGCEYVNFRVCKKGVKNV